MRKRIKRNNPNAIPGNFLSNKENKRIDRIRRNGLDAITGKFLSSIEEMEIRND